MIGPVTSFTYWFIRCFRLLMFTMSVISEYIKTRRVAIAVAILLIIVASFVYFGTDIANRNNKMMYEKIYGNNTDSENSQGVISNKDNTNINTDNTNSNINTNISGIDNNNAQNTKTGLV